MNVVRGGRGSEFLMSTVWPAITPRTVRVILAAFLFERYWSMGNVEGAVAESVFDVDETLARSPPLTTTFSGFHLCPCSQGPDSCRSWTLSERFRRILHSFPLMVATVAGSMRSGCRRAELGGSVLDCCVLSFFVHAASVNSARSERADRHGPTWFLLVISTFCGKSGWPAFATVAPGERPAP